jgi:hypothetical protein
MGNSFQKIRERRQVVAGIEVSTARVSGWAKGLYCLIVPSFDFVLSFPEQERSTKSHEMGTK